jgi:hypothetical protein
MRALFKTVDIEVVEVSLSDVEKVKSGNIAAAALIAEMPVLSRGASDADPLSRSAHRERSPGTPLTTTIPPI